MVSQNPKSITRPYVSSNERSNNRRRKLQDVPATLVRIWTSLIPQDLLVIYERQAFQDDLVRLSLKVDEIILEVSSILTMDGLKVDELLMKDSSILIMDGRVHRPVRPR